MRPFVTLRTPPGWPIKATDPTSGYDNAAPADPLIPTTKTTAKGTCHVLLAVLANGKTKQDEATVNPGKSDIYQLKSVGGQWLDRGIVVVE